MGKFLDGPRPRALGPHRSRSGPGPGARPQGPGPGAGAMSKNLPMKELAHEQELAHSNLAGVGWGGWGGDDFNNQMSALVLVSVHKTE